jgi:hypothetical protein
MLDVIARELQRQQRPASHTDAIRWAVGELAGRITQERGGVTHGTHAIPPQPCILGPLLAT